MITFKLNFRFFSSRGFVQVGFSIILLHSTFSNQFKIRGFCLSSFIFMMDKISFSPLLDWVFAMPQSIRHGLPFRIINTFSMGFLFFKSSWTSETLVFDVFLSLRKIVSSFLQYLIPLTRMKKAVSAYMTFHIIYLKLSFEFAYFITLTL